MKQYTRKEFIKICIANGFKLRKGNGGHTIYVNDKGRHISIPNHLESVITRRLILENQLETDIKKLKKMGRTCDNYPVGAADDKSAPYNEHLDVKHRRFVSLTMSFYANVYGHPDMSEEQIEAAIRKCIECNMFPKEFDIDELVVIDE